MRPDDAYRDLIRRIGPITEPVIVVSHDAIVPRILSGGPVFAWDGRAVGVNIARLHRYLTVAIPSGVAQVQEQAMLVSLSLRRRETGRGRRIVLDGPTRPTRGY